MNDPYVIACPCLACGLSSIPSQPFVAGLTFKYNCGQCNARNTVELSDRFMVFLMESDLDIVVGICDDDHCPQGPNINYADIHEHCKEAQKEDYLVSLLAARRK